MCFAALYKNIDEVIESKHCVHPKSLNPKNFPILKCDFTLPGLQVLHQLTSSYLSFELRIDLEDFEGATRYAKYK